MFLPSNSDERYPKEVGLTRQKHFLELLGNPQRELKVIHIAGTTGKGSTATYIDSLLRGLGQKVGLHVSPHLVDIRERVQVDGTMLSEPAFCRYLTDLIPSIRSLIRSKYGRPTYFQILVTLALYAFRTEGVSYAVMETGVGGMLDSTNAVTQPDKIVVLTRIGKDHTAVLGKTIAEIAFQKAMIMHPGNHAFFVSQGGRVGRVFNSVARQQKAHLHTIRRDTIYIKGSDQNRTVFNIARDLAHISIPTPARYQAENSTLALAAVRFIARRDGIPCNETLLVSILARTRVEGRMQILDIRGKTVVLDAAHNPQKMHGLITTLRHTWNDRKICFLLAFKKGKDYQHMLQLIAPHASEILVSSFSRRTMGADVSYNPQTVVESMNIPGDVRVSWIPDSGSALNKALHQENELIVVTGSIYFLSEMYRHIRELPVDNTSFI